MQSSCQITVPFFLGLLPLYDSPSPHLPLPSQKNNIIFIKKQSGLTSFINYETIQIDYEIDH